MNNVKRIMAVGCVVADIGPVIVTEKDALGPVAWAEFIEGLNAALHGAEIEDMQTAGEISGWWWARRCNGEITLPADHPRLLTDGEIDAELEEYENDRLDREDWSRGQW